MKNSTKIILVTCGYIGSISLSHSQDIQYLEDDELYTKISAELRSGWAWGQPSNLSLARESSGPDDSEYEEGETNS